ncbi:AlpA family transcriptional regulator [Paracoccus pantotrophus]|uniref:AlpA family phage regulatory protein n=1 Tax=Paracoccus pantotrophus TaxID=82367 RepID=A0AAE6NZF6_PARPN|nr:AlpA family phage regulatory protein [Paracoccus pantotrophus]QFG38137.1 AlpA family phage regulatory protein [Paracoccus pantotrophus]RKS51360.1 AlpA family transcriptional regulator [Paracoccus pantotrophus]
MTDEYVTIGWVRRYTKMGRTSIYAGIKAGILPKQVKIGRSSRWLRSEVEAAIAKLAAQRTDN